MQVIWQGKTKNCEPPKAVKDKYKDMLTHVHTESHWSQPPTVAELADDIYSKHVKHQQDESPTGKIVYWILLLDVYISHINPKLIATLKEKYPGLLMLCVPPSCTSELQPLDVLFNGPFKAYLKRLAAQWLAGVIAQQVKDGISPMEVKVPVTKTKLQGPFVGWLAESVKWAR